MRVMSIPSMLAGGLFLVVGCVPAPPDDLDPLGAGAIDGPIAQVDRRTSISAGRPTIHVKNPGDECGVIFTVEPDTRIEKVGSDGRSSGADASILTVGRRVRAWAPVILESCPAQASATRIQVHPDPEIR
jgi:hypothetical protein